MKENKAVFTCDACKKEFKSGFAFYGEVNEILNGDEKSSVLDIEPSNTQKHVCSICIIKTFGLVQTNLR